MAIHDSELTRALESSPPSGADTYGRRQRLVSSGGRRTGITSSCRIRRRVLRSDGTAFAVIGDSNIIAGLLLPNGAPKYPIVISLAAEAIRNERNCASSTNYVAAGGFLMRRFVCVHAQPRRDSARGSLRLPMSSDRTWPLRASQLG